MRYRSFLLLLAVTAPFLGTLAEISIDDQKTTSTDKDFKPGDDLRKKAAGKTTTFELVENPLSMIDKLRGLYLQSSRGKVLGMLPDEVQGVVPEAIIESTDDDQSGVMPKVKLDALVPLLVEGVRAVDCDIHVMKFQYEHQMKDMELEINGLRKSIRRLEHASDDYKNSKSTIEVLITSLKEEHKQMTASTWELQHEIDSLGEDLQKHKNENAKLVQDVRKLKADLNSANDHISILRDSRTQPGLITTQVAASNGNHFHIDNISDEYDDSKVQSERDLLIEANKRFIRGLRGNQEIA